MRFLADVGNSLPIVIAVSAVVVVGLIAFVLGKFVFSRISIKKKVDELEIKFNFLDGLLTGRDAQYIHRLQSISQTNLLYADKHAEFYKRFNEIYNAQDRYVSNAIKQLRALVDDKQYKNIKATLESTKELVQEFDVAVNKLDSELFQIIKPEQETRTAILPLKESLRQIKQLYYSNSSSLEIASNKFNELFEKLDRRFEIYDAHVEDAEYEEANAMIPELDSVIKAVNTILLDLPNLCLLVLKIVPEKIEVILNEFKTVERSGLPVYNIHFNSLYDKWNNSLSYSKKCLSMLKTNGIMDLLDEIQNEIEDVRNRLHKEEENKNNFELERAEVQEKAIALEKKYVKISSLLPSMKSQFVIAPEYDQKIEELKSIVNNLSSSKRMLDNFIHSSTKQPFSVLNEQLIVLKDNYAKADEAMRSFLNYIKQLTEDKTEANSLVLAYYYHNKQIEADIREMNVQAIADKFMPVVDDVYSKLDDINAEVTKTQVDISIVNEKIEELKIVANELFDEIENLKRTQKLAESAILYTNRDRGHQNDVHQNLCVLEKSFYEGNFEHVYHEATELFKNSHIDENQDNGK